MLSAASLDAASIPQQCATGAAECDAQRAALPPKKRPRLLHDCGSSAVQTAVMSAMSQPQASVMEASTAAPLEATLKRAESEASDSGASEGGQLRGSSYQEAWAGEAMQVQSSFKLVPSSFIEMHCWPPGCGECEFRTDIAFAQAVGTSKSEVPARLARWVLYVQGVGLSFT